MTFQDLIAARDATDAKLSQLGHLLNAYPRSEIGLTPDHIKATPEWQATYYAANDARDRLRNINRYLVKHYGKELKAEREAKRAHRRAA